MGHKPRGPTLRSLNHCRSVINGSVTAQEVAALAEHSSSPRVARSMLECHGIYDVVVADADLEITGDLSTFAAKLSGLVVRGSLRVTGRYSDFDDPASFVLVLGDFEAGEVFTAGQLDVLGSARVHGALIGDYNDYSANIGGDLEARLFYPENHFFEVDGEARIAAAVGSRYQINKPVTFVEGPGLREILVDEVLELFGEDDAVELDGSALTRRFREGQPLIRANAAI